MLRFLFLIYMLNSTANKQHSISQFSCHQLQDRSSIKGTCVILDNVWRTVLTGLTSPEQTGGFFEVIDSGDLEPIARELPSNDLFKTRIRVTLGSAKAVTITVYYTTGTVLVQGNRCSSWVRKEFSALMDTIRAMYILANHHTQPDLHKEVDEGLRLLLPSPDNTSTQTTNAGDRGTRPPFVTALLAKAVLSPTPSVTGGCPPATPTSAATTHTSPRPSHPTPTQPNGGQQETTNLFNSNTPPRSQTAKKLMQSAQNPPKAST